MRGADEQSGSMFSYLSPEERVPADHPLRGIRRMTDRALARLSPRFGTLYVKFGRPSVPPEQLLRALLLRSARDELAVEQDDEVDQVVTLLVPPLIDPRNPDFGQIRALVRNALAGHLPSSSTASTSLSAACG